jgi:muconate cycloisomerase
VGSGVVAGGAGADGTTREAAKRNNAAKAAIESALFDAVGKTLGVPAVQLLGGAVRESMPVLWTLASGDPGQEIEEAEKKLAARFHNTFTQR